MHKPAADLYMALDTNMDSEQRKAEAEAKTFKVNMGYLLPYVIVLALNGICNAWTTAGSNQTSTLFAAKFGWTEDETKFYNTA